MEYGITRAHNNSEIRCTCITLTVAETKEDEHRRARLLYPQPIPAYTGLYGVWTRYPLKPSRLLWVLENSRTSLGVEIVYAAP